MEDLSVRVNGIGLLRDTEENLSMDIGVPACLVDIFGCEKWKLYLVY